MTAWHLTIHFDAKCLKTGGWSTTRGCSTTRFSCVSATVHNSGVVRKCFAFRLHDSTTPRLHDQEAKKFSERYVTRPVLEEEVPRRNQYNILYNILSEMPSDSVLRGNFKTCLLDSVTTRHVLLGFGIVINVFADLSWFVLICQPFLIRSVASSSAAKPTWGSAGLQCAAGRT